MSWLIVSEISLYPLCFEHKTYWTHPIKSEKNAGESSNDVGSVLVEWVDNFSILRADATKSVHFTRIPATSIGDAHKQSVLVDSEKSIIENYLQLKSEIAYPKLNCRARRQTNQFTHLDFDW